MEYSVVILAGGRGSHLYPLAEKAIKPLLPVANRALLSYQLEFLEKYGFQDIFVVTNDECRDEVQKYIVEDFDPKQLKVHVKSFKLGMGTAEVIFGLKDQLKSDFIVISGDLILDGAMLHDMADVHRTYNATLTAMFTTPQGSSKEVVDSEKKGGKSAPKAAADKGASEKFETEVYVGLGERKGTGNALLYYKAAADVDSSIDIHKKILRRFPKVSFYTQLRDAHLYIFSLSVLDVFAEKFKKAFSLRDEIVPHIVRAQFRSQFDDAKGIVDSNSAKILKQAAQLELCGELRDSGGSPIRCFARVLHRGDDAGAAEYCLRASTPPDYVKANFDIARNATCYRPSEQKGPKNNNYIDESATVPQKSTVGPDCVVGLRTVIGEKSSLKKSVVGSHCQIGNMVKIVNSIIMDHVTIKDKCIIQNTIISSNAYVKENCKIRQSKIGVAFSVAENSEIVSEELLISEISAEL